MQKYKIYTTLILALIFGACSSTKNKTTINNGIKPCTKEYVPVCAEIKVECITAPCKPIKKTFSNMCVMRNSKNAKFLYKGSCR